MDFETIKNNAVNAFRQLSVLRVIVTSPMRRWRMCPRCMRWPPCCSRRRSARRRSCSVFCSNTASGLKKTR